MIKQSKISDYLKNLLMSLLSKRKILKRVIFGHNSQITSSGAIDGSNFSKGYMPLSPSHFIYIIASRFSHVITGISNVK